MPALAVIGNNTTVLAKASEPDKELRHIADRYGDNVDTILELEKEIARLRGVAKAHHPQPAACLSEPLETPVDVWKPSHYAPNYAGGGLIWRPEELGQLVEGKVWFDCPTSPNGLQPVPEALKKRAEEILIVRMEYDAEVICLSEEIGLTKAKIDLEEVRAEQSELIKRALGIQSETIVGIKAKLELTLLQNLYGSGDHRQLLVSASLDADELQAA